MMGGGAGHILAMINRIKANEALRKKKSYFRNRKDYHWVLKRKNIQYHHCTPEDLEEIREKVLLKRKKDLMLTLTALGIALPLAALVCWYIVKLVTNVL